MKISKLFHWLYASVMLLPIFAIGVTCGYAIFNKNAYLSYSQKVNTSVETVKNNDTVNAGTTITATYNGGSLYDNPFPINVLNNETDILKFFPQENFIVSKFNLLQSGGRTRLIVFDTENNQYNAYNWQNEYSSFYFVNADNLTFTTINNANFNLTYITYVNASVSDVFYYSIDKVQESPLFNWAYNSFLVTPFAYIVNLFSMPSNSFIVMLLSYWLAISIIWLVFDLVMYVPLLVHRWLDKGVLE